MLCSCHIIRSKLILLSVKLGAFLALRDTELADHASSVAWDNNKFLLRAKSDP
jgi:hypothetical protein